MANNAFIKLPEFGEFSPTAWFAQTEAQFAIRDVTDDTTRYYHVVSALGRSTATRAANFIANPPDHGKYRDLKAFLLKTFGLSQSERAQRLLAIRGLGDSKPSEHMEMMLNLLGAEGPNFLFMELFLQHMPLRSGRRSRARGLLSHARWQRKPTGFSWLLRVTHPKC